ncbi:MAG: AraC family transcriptional regulator [Calditrichota bacterium]
MKIKSLHLLPETLLASTQENWQSDSIIVTNYKTRPKIGKKYCFTPYHLFIYVHSGMQMIHRNGNSYMIGEGEACLIKYGDFSLSEMPTGNPIFQSTMLFLSDEIIKRLLKNSPLPSEQSEPASNIFKIAGSHILTTVIHSLQQQLSSEQNSSNLEEQTSFILGQILKPNTGNELKIFLQSLSEPLETELPILFSDKQRLLLPLTALAKIVGRSFVEFEKEITKEYAISPQEWLNEKRLEHAYFLLTHTPDSIEDIAVQTGFANPAEFLSRFEKKFGQSPQEVSETAGR